MNNGLENHQLPVIEKFSKNFLYLRRKIEIFMELLCIHNKHRKVSGRMNITDVRLKKVNTEGKMKAIASITIDDAFVVRDIRVIEGQNGLFVAMPSRKTPDGEFRDIAHPITSDARELIQSAILKEYEKAE